MKEFLGWHCLNTVINELSRRLSFLWFIGKLKVIKLDWRRQVVTKLLTSYQTGVPWQSTRLSWLCHNFLVNRHQITTEAKNSERRIVKCPVECREFIFCVENMCRLNFPSEPKYSIKGSLVFWVILELDLLVWWKVREYSPTRTATLRNNSCLVLMWKVNKNCWLCKHVII